MKRVWNRQEGWQIGREILEEEKNIRAECKIGGKEEARKGEGKWKLMERQGGETHEEKTHRVWHKRRESLTGKKRHRVRTKSEKYRHEKDRAGERWICGHTEKEEE